MMVVRMIMPVLWWFPYFVHGSGSGPVFTSLLTGGYLVLKARDSVRVSQPVLDSVRAAWTSAGSQGYGQVVYCSRITAWSPASSTTNQKPGDSPVMKTASDHSTQLDGEGVVPGDKTHLASTAAPTARTREDIESGPLHHEVTNLSARGAACTSCPICQEYVSVGIRLKCSHLFCDDCISQWLEKNRTCPMCRVEIENAGQLCSNNNGICTATSVMARAPIIF
ncbi:hypothetical protein CEUSTIGMA_g7786.t1 [Chlamydomonas eustigma]|uniref:RING-type domain-containing protein n=1 Tax=Chlamydomonas eustigma TaxID=1157962 RepID=A0A250XB87_9CHLO|nr:hypothetical protein CEUSTIGMA_g7786.t1 [Chlamydomonas eustigma]|eukprot:GAX80347.1 hypothetical protein CEUSTIGMA_g7786.t1 [Chlamydomonas eustigma]